MTRSEIDTIAFGPHALRVLAARPEYGYAEGRYVPGVPGPPSHRHPWDETFYVVSGALAVVVGGAERTLGPGDFALAPGEELHTFSVAGSEPAVFVAGFHPGVGLAYVREIAAIWTSTGPDPEVLPDLHAKYGVTRGP